jgi:putative ABC transport system permease protein
MFWRVVFKLLRGSSGRLAVAVLALVSGAAVISALLNLDLDVQRKLTKEFRTLGANVVVSPRIVGAATQAAGPNEAPALMDEGDIVRAITIPDDSVVAVAPFLYVVAKSGEKSVVVAGTWLEELSKLEPSWKVEGKWARPPETHTQCLAGRIAAKNLGIHSGSTVSLATGGRTASCSVVGVIDSGGDEDNQLFVSSVLAARLADRQGFSLAQISVRGNADTISDYANHLGEMLPAYQVRPLRQVADAEGALLARIRLLIVAMIVLILVLTALCVLGTMAALAMERREDVGLMKALGGSISRVVGIFLAEVGVLGAVGGVIGTLLGFALSYWMGLRVFGAAISPRWEVFPITVALMIVVALTGALPLRLLGGVKPAVIFRGE